jgi:tetratricopeptide (TPR) repeat protein
MRTIGLAALALAIATAAFGADATHFAWETAQAVLDATQADLQKEGIRSVERHVPDLERELKTAISVNTVIQGDDGKRYTLADGMGGSFLSIIASAAVAKKDKKASEVITVPDPYPLISLYLGSYYNEIGKPDEALRVLDAGIAVSDIDGLGFGDTNSLLLSEKGTALIALKRFDESLAVYNKGLTLGLEDRDRARLYRGRGFSLTELGKLDEAEKAYRDSLTCEPGNQNAENELRYIAQKRAGAPSTPSAIATVAPSDPNAPKVEKCATE